MGCRTQGRAMETSAAMDQGRGHKPWWRGLQFLQTFSQQQRSGGLGFILLLWNCDFLECEMQSNAQGVVGQNQEIVGILEAWLTGIQATKAQIRRLLALLDPVHLRALPEPRKNYKRAHFDSNDNLRHLWYRNAASILGWKEQTKFPDHIHQLVKTRVFPCATFDGVQRRDGQQEEEDRRVRSASIGGREPELDFGTCIGNGGTRRQDGTSNGQSPEGSKRYSSLEGSERAPKTAQASTTKEGKRWIRRSRKTEVTPGSACAKGESSSAPRTRQRTWEGEATS